MLFYKALNCLKILQGHTCRKLGRYDDSLSYHQQALLIKPLQASTYSAIGFVQVSFLNLNEL
jgi:hypothetical protein